MAHIESIWIHSHNFKDKKLTAHVNIKPSGSAQVRFNIPDEFYDCLLKMAQNAADLHEQQMRAEILADSIKETKNDE